MSKNNSILQIIAIVVIISVSIIVFFFQDIIPEEIDTSKFSYDNIVNKKEEVDSLIDLTSSNESVIEDTIQRLQSTKERAREVEKEANLVRQGVNQDDFVLDIPSFLIDLEQNAYKNEVELKIDYNSMVTSSSRVSDGYHLDGEEYEEDFGEPSDQDFSGEGDSSGVGGSLEEQEDEGVTLETQDEEQSFDGEQDVGQDSEFSPGGANLPDIEGISITVIPISISGKYSDVRNYIKYLDQVGMIEPYSVKLESDGDSISGSVILNVFHEEVY